MKLTLISFALTILLIVSCSAPLRPPLPILGEREVIGTDTIYHTIPEFSFMDQTENIVTNQSLSDYIYLTDFFFMSCPSICPKVMQQMLRIHDEFKDNNKVKLVSFTLDPKRDTPEKLKQYAENLGVSHNKWLFLHGDKDKVYDINDEYFVAAYEDEEAPGGINHSGKIILVDTKGHVRSFGEGTDPEDVDKLIDDIKFLLQEYE